MVTAAADLSVNDEFVDTKCEESRQVFVVITAATLADGVPSLISWTVEVQRDMIVFVQCLLADLTARFLSNDRLQIKV
ncbi:hypothetical protein [Halonotius pteroides]|uniref:Uncharacterized protein n=1 Tax=Halonotius pteroides TaxID=268735 RepID=A0A3A6QC38_9EURY|nr:hypothetical protein [Halonotius pteroides]RJX50311.1 hypothetical protein DP106_05250 [Halonotius pteroides]